MSVRIHPYCFIAGLVFLVAGVPWTHAQIRGVPASVTSFGFGGSTSFTPGVAASVTSLGPRGFDGGGRFSNCCFSPFFQTGSQSPIFFRGHHFRHAFFPVGVPVYSVPYTQVVVVQPEAVADDDDDYEGGPTIFDRRGSGHGRPRRVREVEPEPAPAATSAVAAAPPEAVVAQPSTLLVFRDGHQAELQNYAIVGDTLFDLTGNRSHKIQLDDVDLAATKKANEERGVDFQVPGVAIVTIR